ncbi:DUF4381 domain-containing protein [Tolumonas lignilytica]|uniref:DUF4381 domain-containing protein n=1 Tax=Tolumonas lignilytica TaxID=1283284 RepID=UPI00046565C0|nr:DUF4381 domain-containing protein [Tolumonas lignilytica]
MKAPIDKLHDILPGPDIDAFNKNSIIFIAIFIAIILIFLLYTTYTKIPQYKFHLHANRELRYIFKNKQDKYIPCINIFLKKSASHFWEREKFAKLHTREWLQFLDNHSSCNFLQYAESWEIWSYSVITPSDKEKKAIYNECKRWIKAIKNRRPL